MNSGGRDERKDSTGFRSPVVDVEFEGMLSSSNQGMHFMLIQEWEKEETMEVSTAYR